MDIIAENARLRAALEPFAMIADLIDEETEGVSTTDEFGLFFLNGESDEPVWFAERFSVQKFKEARAALATPAPDAVQEAAIDIAAIENGGKRWHGEDHRVVSVRWEPYKPDGRRQMKAKGRWQEQVGSGDYWRWNNCDRPSALRAIAGSGQ